MTRLAPGGTRLTRRGVVQVALAVLLYGAGLNAGAGWVVVLAAVLAGAVLVGYGTVRRAARRVDARREVPALGVAGSPLEVTVEVRAPGTGDIVVVDALGGLAGAGPPGGGFAGLMTAGRGARDGGVVRVELADWFGLAHASAAGAVPSPVVVVPAVADDAAFGLHPAGGATDSGTQRARSGIEFAGVRAYAPGDPPRSVRWRATARHGRLLVGEPASQTAPALRIAIGGGIWDREELDRVTERVCGLAAAAAMTGRPVEIAADGRVQPWSQAARRDLALLPPHWGAPARPLAPPPSGSVETIELTGRG